MRKILSVGILVLGSLGSVQAQTVSVPILEKLELDESVEQKIVASEQKFRDFQMLARELEQLQVFLKNLKRASPKLWDGSLNAFENLANATAPIDTIASAVKDFGGVLQRTGCANGVYDTAKSSSQQPDYSVEFNPGASTEAQVADYRRGQLRRRCRGLLTTLQTEKEIQKKAAESKVDVQKQAKDKEAGSNVIMDNMMAELVRTRIQMMEGQKAEADLKRQAIEQEFAEVEQRQAMHERLMQSPSSTKKIKAKNPALTVDPRNY